MEARLNNAFQAAVDSKKMPGCGGIVLDKSGNVLWKGAFGTTNIMDPEAPAYGLDTPLMIFSCTKLVTTVLALQLLEEGKLSLDDPVEKYCPEFAQLQVLEGFDEEGRPKYRDPKTKATILHLLTHTTGLAYDFFSPSLLQWRIATGQEPASTMAAGVKHTFEAPLLFDPGQEYCYGMNTDWLGFVLEAITGTKIADLVDSRIVKPLQLRNTGPGRTFVENAKERMVAHMRKEDESLIAVPSVGPLPDPEVHGGGEFLVSSINDYAQILLTLLNGGEHPTLKVRLLKEETVRKYLFEDLISQICSPENVGLIPSTIPQLTLTGQFLPGVRKTWSAALLINEEDVPKGRTAGSGAWAGLGNLYFFVDPAAGKLAFFATSIFPFFDPESLHLWDEMERAVYGHESRKRVDEAGGNHGPWDMPKASL
jgi:methyl acetate hydrolase